jgi:hypothetical protein
MNIPQRPNTALNYNKTQSTGNIHKYQLHIIKRSHRIIKHPENFNKEDRYRPCKTWGHIFPSLQSPGPNPLDSTTQVSPSINHITYSLTPYWDLYIPLLFLTQESHPEEGKSNICQNSGKISRNMTQPKLMHYTLVLETYLQGKESVQNVPFHQQNTCTQTVFVVHIYFHVNHLW